MVLIFSTLDEHIVHIYFHIPLNLSVEHMVYQSLVCGPRILQTERHDLVAIEPLTGDEGSLLLILFLFALNEHIINVYLHISSNLFFEHLVHQSLIGGPCVL